MKSKKMVLGFLGALSLAVVISYGGILVPAVTTRAEAAVERPWPQLCQVITPGGGYDACTTCPAGVNCVGCVNNVSCY